VAAGITGLAKAHCRPHDIPSREWLDAKRLAGRRRRAGPCRAGVPYYDTNHTVAFPRRIYSWLFLLEYAADRFIDHTAIVAQRLGVSQALVASLTAGAEWEEVRSHTIAQILGWAK
jgi:hypothetical protein